MTLTVTNSMYDERSTPSQIFAQGLGYFGGAQRARVASLMRTRPGLGYFGGRAAPGSGLGYFGGRAAPGLGDASINPLTGGDTGVSDPLPGASTSFNWGSLVTSALTAAAPIISATTGGHPSVPVAKTPLASPISLPLVLGGIAALGALGFVAFGGRRSRR